MERGWMMVEPRAPVATWRRAAGGDLAETTLCPPVATRRWVAGVDLAEMSL